MQQFKIFRADPFKYKEEIISLWKNNLPDTPPGRLEWMANNPEGSATWYLAMDQKSQIVVGSVSIMPKRLKLRGETYLVGITGDLMVGKEYRVFGPFLQLLKTVIKDHPRLGFAFLYTFPNRASEKVVLRAGFKKIGLTKRFVKPINSKNKLQKYMHPGLVNAVFPGLNFVLRLLSKETYMKANISVEKITEPKALRESSWMETENQRLTLGEKSPGYIKWRYCQNPLSKFHIYIYKQPTDNLVLGQIIFNIKNNCIHIFDIAFNNLKSFELVLGRFIKDMRKNDYNSISVRILKGSPLNEQFRKFRFFDREEDVPLLFAGDPKLLPTKWLFFDGDRNV